jgi:Pyruvate/2-oxoacid:ferredoxin oxidoreductase delta subunit
MMVGSAAIASPLLLEMAGSVADAKTSTSKIAKGTKVYFINRTCIGCQICRTFCPAEAIHYGDGANEIDQNKCIHCGTCYEECLINAVSETEV